MLFVVGCGAAPVAAERAGAPPGPPVVDPEGEPAPPQPPPKDGRAALNTEYFLGSEAEEQAQFAEFARRIQELQKESSRSREQPLQRGFHAKSHACLRGLLHLERARDPRTRYGVFADGQPERAVIVRFSNGVGWKQSDVALDARGMAVKVLGVPGPKYLPDEPSTQDFLMTNSPTPVGRDAVEFMEFARANASGRVAELFFTVGHASTGALALSRTNPVDSMVTEQYWSGGAYHLGAHQAVKVTARPCDPALARHPDRSSPDYLRKDLAEAAHGGICMRLFVQIQADPELTPIENASRPWDPAVAPPLPVARMLLPPQEVPADAASTDACDAMAFSPWHSIPAHKPMGHINRARRYVYAASQDARRATPTRGPE
jgi:hypothetical protein